MKLTIRSTARVSGSLADRTALKLARQRGKIGWILLWLLGIPLPILFGLFLLRGCT